MSERGDFARVSESAKSGDWMGGRDRQREDLRRFEQSPNFAFLNIRPDIKLGGLDGN
jgi:hypothetical protein